MINKANVVIAGGGMTGMAAACLLAKSGLDILLLESGPAVKWQAGELPGRVSALNLASQRLFESVDVWQSFQDQRISPYRHMTVWDSHSEARIRFDADSHGLPSLGHIVENNLVVQTMQEKLRHNYNVKILCDSKVTGIDTGPEQIDLQISTPNGDQQVSAALVIAADGSHSSLRHFANIDVVREEFDQQAVVATVECEQHHQDTAWQCFTPAGPVALLPLSGSLCSLVYSCDRDQLAQLASGDNQVLEGHLQALFGPELGKIEIRDQPRRFPLYNQHACRYIGDRIALVGDAAHTTHPLAGLGANIGLLDAAALCELVSKAYAAGKPIYSQSLLRRYERWRRGDNSTVLLAMKAFKTLFGNTDPMLVNLRQSGFALADRLSPVKQQLAEYAIGLTGDLPASCR